MLTACDTAIARVAESAAAEDWPEPGSYAAADIVLLGGETDADALESLWILQNEDGGFPLFHGGPSHVEASAKVWAAMRLAGCDSPRIESLARAVKALGGIAALGVTTRVEWALIGLIPRDLASDDSPAGQVLRAVERKGGIQRRLELAEIGGAAARAGGRQGGHGNWFSRNLGKGKRQRELAARIEELRRIAETGFVQDPLCRAAWLAVNYAGGQASFPASAPPPSHLRAFSSSRMEETLGRQDGEGAWRDEEGWIHGTWQALEALHEGGCDEREAAVLRAGEWLRSAQNADGGWGEAPDGSPSASTVSHTAWALLGLIAGGDPASQSATMAVDYLLAAQSPDGSWRERAWTRIVRAGLAFMRDEQRANADAATAIRRFVQANRGNRGTNG